MIFTLLFRLLDKEKGELLQEYVGHKNKDFKVPGLSALFLLSICAIDRQQVEL